MFDSCLYDASVQVTTIVHCHDLQQCKAIYFCLVKYIETTYVSLQTLYRQYGMYHYIVHNHFL